jgi:flavorubredoxin
MKDVFTAVKVTDRVFWVGAVDWNVRDFHGYATNRGTTYNAYIVMADKITLIDTVKAPFKEEMMSRIASVIDPAKIDYIVSNHSEMDHSASLPAVLESIKPEKVFASAMGRNALEEHFHMNGNVDEVKDGGDIDLGNMKITCFETRMLHWPDSMVSYLHEEKLLFSQDAFGMHLATSDLFDDEIPKWLLEHEAAKYYANILMPFSHLVLKALERIAGLGVEIDLVAPDHGPIWRENIEWILGLYGTWAKRAPGNKAVIFYDTMWGSTDLMARAIADGLREGGTVVKVLKLGSAHRSDIATELLDAGAVVVGSPTLNNHMFPSVADALTYIKGLKPKGLFGFAFGSYGWSGESVKHIEEMLAEMKVDIKGEGIKVRYVPTAEDLRDCRSRGMELSEKLREITASA